MSSIADFFIDDEDLNKKVEASVKKAPVKKKSMSKKKEPEPVVEVVTESQNSVLIKNLFQTETTKNIFGPLTNDLQELLISLVNDISFIKKNMEVILKEVEKNTEQEAQINAHVEIIQKLINNSLTPEHSESSLNWVQPEEPVKSSGANSSSNDKKKIFIKKHDDTYMKVFGNTFDKMNIIKSVTNGAKWNSTTGDKGWIINISDLKQLEEKFKSNSIEYTLLN